MALCFRYKHWDDFEHLKEGISEYIPGVLGLADLTLYCVAASCVLLSMFGVLPSWISCTAIFALPHYVSDACTLEMITLKLVVATFEWKLLAAHNVLYVHALGPCMLLVQQPCAARNCTGCAAHIACSCDLRGVSSPVQPSGSVLGCQTCFVTSELWVCGSGFSLDSCSFPAWTLLLLQLSRHDAR